MVKPMTIKASLLAVLLGIFGSQSSYGGGVDGGGGNTRPLHPVTEKQVREVLNEGRPLIIFLLNNYSNANHENADPLVQKLFRGPVSLLDRLRRIDVTLETNGPCFDSAGNAVDGSASQVNQTVCISLPRLTSKLSLETLKSQALALVAHEYSHLIGTTEAEAEELQEHVSRVLLNDEAKEMLRAASDAKYFLEPLVPKVNQWRGRLDQLGWAGLKELTAKVIPGFSKFLTFRTTEDYSLNADPEHAIAFLENMRLWVLQAEAYILNGDDSRHLTESRLNIIFQGYDEIDGRLMFWYLGQGRFELKDVDPVLAKIKFRRIRDRATAESEFAKSADYLSAFQRELAAAMRPLLK